MKAFVVVATVIAFHFAVATEEEGVWALADDAPRQAEPGWALTSNDAPQPEPPSSGQWSYDAPQPEPPSTGQWSYDDSESQDFFEHFWNGCQRRGWESCFDKGDDRCYEGFGCKRGPRRRCRWFNCRPDFGDCFRRRGHDHFCRRSFCHKRCF